MMTSEARKPPTDEELASAAPVAAERVVLPISLLDEKKVLPRDYIIHRRSVACKNCGRIHEYCDVYARNELPPRYNTAGKYVQNLMPITDFRFNLPVRVVEIEERYVPVCHECVEQLNLSHLSDPRNTALWNAVLVRKAEQELGEKKPRSKKKSAPPTLDDIL